MELRKLSANSEIRKLRTASLKDALLEMSVGETCLGPDECSRDTVKRVCSELNGNGHHYMTAVRGGVLYVTRLK